MENGACFMAGYEGLSLDESRYKKAAPQTGARRL